VLWWCCLDGHASTTTNNGIQVQPHLCCVVNDSGSHVLAAAVGLVLRLCVVVFWSLACSRFHLLYRLFPSMGVPVLSCRFPQQFQPNHQHKLGMSRDDFSSSIDHVVRGRWLMQRHLRVLPSTSTILLNNSTSFSPLEMRCDYDRFRFSNLQV
jgi:hypothetical protein